jgi:hypothetical protein
VTGRCPPKLGRTRTVRDIVQMSVSRSCPNHSDVLGRCPSILISVSGVSECPSFPKYRYRPIDFFFFIDLFFFLSLFGFPIFPFSYFSLFLFFPFPISLNASFFYFYFLLFDGKRQSSNILFFYYFILMFFFYFLGRTANQPNSRRR